MSSGPVRRWGGALLGITVAAGLLGGGSAQAIGGGGPVADGTYRFAAKVSFGDVRACSGALIDKDWVVTAKSCFTDGTTAVTAGEPSRPSTVLVGRTDLTGSAGHQRRITSITPHPTRNLALARLSAPVTDVPPIPLATAAPVATETLLVAGYGRTATEWVPTRLHAGSFTVAANTATGVELVGASAGATICRGDAGGPVFREASGTVELVAINDTSWQKGCIEETETRDGATGTRVDDLGWWIREQLADVQIFGILADGRLTYSAIGSASGSLPANRTSAAALGFTAKTMATLNANTILATDTGGTMHRIDITSVDPLTFTTTALYTGWGPYDRLVYDGYGSLYGIVGGTFGNELRRFTLTSHKPVQADFTRSTTISTGFGLQTLASPGPGRIVGTTSTGRMVSYQIHGTNSWTGSDIHTTGWSSRTHLVTPGGGLYYTRNTIGQLERHLDTNPFDGKGTDWVSYPGDPVSPSGWNQVLLSARPWTGLVSVFGTKTDGKLSWTAVDPVTGAKKASSVSAQTLGFTPKALAALNSDTLLVTSTAAQLYRVDVVSHDPLVFTRTESLAGGWTHDRLVYDGSSYLFGTAGGYLRRYALTKPKPVAADIVGVAVQNDSGFSLPSLASPGRNRITATTSDGKLAAYDIDAANVWHRNDLAASGWSGVTSLFSPGGGRYYRRDSAGVVTGHLDNNPFDDSGADLTASVPTGTASGGWDPILTARPYEAWPDTTRRY